MDACTEGEKLMTSHEFLDFRRKTKVHNYFFFARYKITHSKVFSDSDFQGFLSNSVTD